MVKKADIILATAIVLAAVLLFCGSLLLKNEGAKAVITVDGSEFGEYSLDIDKTIVVNTKLGSNTVVIKDGKVTVTEADCPDGYCVSHVAVDSTGETIVCLPHRMIVEIRE